MSNNKLLYFIQLPPPIHGVSTVNKIVCCSPLINQDFDTKVININFTDDLNQLNNISFTKIYKLIGLIYQVLYSLILFKPNYVYFSIVPLGKGFIRDSFFVFFFKLFKTKIIYHLHGNGISDVKSIFLKKLYNFTFSGSSIIHLSQGLVDKEISPLNLNKHNVYIVPNGVSDTKQIKKSSNKHIPTILFLSNYSESKGLLVLMESARILKLKNIKFHLRIVGKPINIKKEYIFSLLDKYNISENVTFPGQKFGLDKHNEFCNADIFVFPSLNDTFPLVLIEAMKYSLPIVGSIEGAIPEIIDDGFTGFTVPKYDFESVANKLELLIKNYSLRVEMGFNANQKFKKIYTLEKFENNMMLTFNKILECVE